MNESPDAMLAFEEDVCPSARDGERIFDSDAIMDEVCESLS